jgi:transposase
MAKSKSVMPSRSAQRAKPPAFVICVQTIERLFNRLKQFRRIATRYEKRAANYLAMLHIAAITLWL